MDPEVHNRIHISQTFFPDRKKIKFGPQTLFYLFRINFNIILAASPSHSVMFLFFGFYSQKHARYFVYPIRATTP
jgi:hypothetical protein